MSDFADSPLRLLLLDLDPAFARRLIQVCADAAPPGLALTTTSDVSEAESLLREQSFDALLLGTEAASKTDLAPFAQLQKLASSLPVILLTAADDDDTSLMAVREGAANYLLKDSFNSRELMRVLRSAIERKRVENQLRLSEEFFRLISENVTDLIAVVDRNGRRLYNNPAYERSLGRTAGLAGTDSFHEIHPEDRTRIQSLFQETLATGQGKPAEYRLLLGNGEVRYIESLGNVVLDASGRPDKIVVVSRDITERRQAMDELQRAHSELQQTHAELQAAQERLVQTEKIEALSTFAAGIAHEVRNPLQTILLGIDFLRESLRDPGMPDAATQQLVLTDLDNAARKADAVIQGLLEFTAYRQQEIQAHSLSLLVEQSLQAVHAELEQRHIQVKLDLARQLPKVNVDARKIRHVLIKMLLGLADRLPVDAPLLLETVLTTMPRRPAQAAHSPVAAPAACIQLQHPAPAEPVPIPGASAPVLILKEDLDLMVVKKVVELYGGIVETSKVEPGLTRTRILFRTESTK